MDGSDLYLMGGSFENPALYHLNMKTRPHLNPPLPGHGPFYRKGGSIEHSVLYHLYMETRPYRHLWQTGNL